MCEKGREGEQRGRKERRKEGRREGGQEVSGRTNDDGVGVVSQDYR